MNALPPEVKHHVLNTKSLCGGQTRCSGYRQSVYLIEDITGGPSVTPWNVTVSVPPPLNASILARVIGKSLDLILMGMGWVRTVFLIPKTRGNQQEADLDSKLSETPGQGWSDVYSLLGNPAWAAFGLVNKQGKCGRDCVLS